MQAMTIKSHRHTKYFFCRVGWQNIFLFGLMLIMPLLAATAIAATPKPPEPADTPCDQRYYGSVKARAWLESQRELTHNQNLIFKPDSVLEYTCFGRFLNQIAAAATDPLFSETTEWGSILPSTSMDNALQNLVGQGVITWLNSNFELTSSGSYDLLGGRLNPGPPTLGPTNPRVDYEPTAVNSSGYQCRIMNSVWMHAKCLDFIEVSTEDGFWGFGHYMNYPDPRFLPQRCPGIQGRWEQNIGHAYDDVPYDGVDQTSWTEDFVITFLDKIDPDNCNKKDSDGNLITPPIETGMIVRQRTNPSEYYEKICVAPGCYYEPTSKTKGECKKSPKTSQ
jgi:hypothetical protein